MTDTGPQGQRERETMAGRLDWLRGRTHRRTRSGPTEDEINGILEDAAALLRRTPTPPSEEITRGDSGAFWRTRRNGGAP